MPRSRPNPCHRVWNVRHSSTQLALVTSWSRLDPARVYSLFSLSRSLRFSFIFLFRDSSLFPSALAFPSAPGLSATSRANGQFKFEIFCGLILKSSNTLYHKTHFLLPTATPLHLRRPLLVVIRSNGQDPPLYSAYLPMPSPGRAKIRPNLPPKRFCHQI